MFPLDFWQLSLTRYTVITKGYKAIMKLNKLNNCLMLVNVHPNTFSGPSARGMFVCIFYKCLLAHSFVQINPLSIIKVPVVTSLHSYVPCLGAFEFTPVVDMELLPQSFVL